ncbi:MAG: uroporphyrinogen-III synthase, partial [Bdellovibrionia bacterium]
AQLLKENGSDVIEVPRIWTEALEQTSQESQNLDSAIRSISSFKNLVFSCEEGVSFFIKRMLSLGFDVRHLHSQQIIAMGTQVRETLACHGIATDVFIEGHCLQSIAQKASVLRDERTLVVSSSRGRANLSIFLKRLSISATIVPTYRYRHQFPSFVPPRVDFIVLPSSTSATLLLDGPWRQHYLNTSMIALGPVTREAALNMGATNVYQTESEGIEELLPLIRKLKKVKESRL